MEFLVSRQARDRFQFDQSLFSLDGNVLFANFNASRLFANKINQQLDLVNFPETGVKAGQINALGLLDEILHHVIELYRRQKNPHAMQEALAWLQNHLGSASVERLLVDILTHFPPIAVYRSELSLEEYLESETDGVSNRLAALEYLLLLWVANKNPALEPYRFLFPDDELAVSAVYTHSIEQLHAFFETQPAFGPDQQNLIDMLRSPAIAVPHSLYGQLEYIRTRWLELLGGFLYPLLSSLDLIREEEKIAFFAPGVVGIPIYAAAGDQERFSRDRVWMPHLVLIAKNTHVWLDQLAKKYRRSITRLDQIPDEELDTLAQWGINGLWLIGLWERSQASARIKQMMGNPAA
ncbi:MAG: alpha-amylase, partial [Anaerolineaceae bacterium]|nr:alpha-amylase [Anaerolineaceae bacterium]